MCSLVRTVLVLALAAAAGAGCADSSTSADGDAAPKADPAGIESAGVESAGVEPGDAAPRMRAGSHAPARAAAAPRGAAVRVARVVDGDTIDLADGRTVRLVQIDTPEVYGGAECGGRAASDAMHALVPAGARVRLVRDPVTDDRDRYGRLLRYVYVGSRNVNVLMVARGHATPYFYDGERGRFAAQLMRGTRAAQARDLGIWGACPNAVLDAYRGVSTGPASSSGTGGSSGAASGANALGSGRLPLAPAGGRDLDCVDFPGPVRVTAGDPHRLDADGDGIGCDR